MSDSDDNAFASADEGEEKTPPKERAKQGRLTQFHAKVVLIGYQKIRLPFLYKESSVMMRICLLSRTRTF